jgi:hypothetical protein
VGGPMHQVITTLQGRPQRCRRLQSFTEALLQLS